MGVGGAENVRGRGNPPMPFREAHFQNTAWLPGSLGEILPGENGNCRINSSVLGLPGDVCAWWSVCGGEAGLLVSIKAEAAARHKSRAYAAQVYSRDI